jgi:hypothetical protein
VCKDEDVDVLGQKRGAKGTVVGGSGRVQQLDGGPMVDPPRFNLGFPISWPGFP